MKNIYILLILIIGGLNSWGIGNGTNNNKPVLTIQERTLPEGNKNAWSLLETLDGVKIYRTYSDCSENKRIFLKVENNNTYNVTVSWNSIFKLSAKKIPVDHKFSVFVPATSTKTGTCENDELTLNPFNYVTVIEEGVCDYFIENLNIEK